MNITDTQVGVFLKTLEINTEADYKARLAYIEDLMGRFNSGERDLASVLDYVAKVVQAYEELHYPMEKSAPEVILRNLMESHGHTQRDLREIATQSVISDLLTGKRTMNLRHIKKLSKFYGVSPEFFISEDKE